MKRIILYIFCVVFRLSTARIVRFNILSSCFWFGLVSVLELCYKALSKALLFCPSCKCVADISYFPFAVSFTCLPKTSVSCMSIRKCNSDATASMYSL